MAYDYRMSSYYPMYRQSSSSSSSSSTQSQSHSYGQSMYPRVGTGGAPPPPVGHPSPYHHHHTAPPPPPPSSSSTGGLGIRVSIKPEYRITPPPPLSPQVGDILRSNFQFDFDFEKKVLAEAEKENPNWSRLAMENLPARTAEPVHPSGPVGDPVVSKFIASGLNREAVPIAVANYGDNPVKVSEFVNGYNLLREMGFSSNSVAETLAMYDNDMDKALGHFLNNAS